MARLELALRSAAVVSDKARQAVADVESNGTHQDGAVGVSVAASALPLLGAAYVQAEELTPSGIDCSTLTSQAHWEGSLQGIPFTAVGQSRGKWGVKVARGTERTGDIVLRKPTQAEAPCDHVGLVLGVGASGTTWIIESAGGVGVRVVTLPEFDADCGIVRYIADEPVVADARLIRAYARRVPKMSRLGAKQYLRTGSDRREHLGVDVFCSPGTPAFSPLRGVTSVMRSRGGASRLVVASSDSGDWCALENIENYSPSVTEKLYVERGEYLGTVTHVPGDVDTVYPPTTYGSTHLHMEVARVIAGADVCIESNGWRYVNGLLQCARGSLAWPLGDIDDVPAIG